MRRIKTNELPSLGAGVPIEIHLKSEKIIVGYISATKSSINSSTDYSNGVLDYLVYRLENEIEDEQFIANYYDRMIPADQIKEIYIK